MGSIKSKMTHRYYDNLAIELAEKRKKMEAAHDAQMASVPGPFSDPYKNTPIELQKKYEDLGENL